MHIQNRNPRNPSITTIRQHPNNRETASALLGRLSDVFYLDSATTNHQELHGGSFRAAFGGVPIEKGGLPQTRCCKMLVMQKSCTKSRAKMDENWMRTGAFPHDLEKTPEWWWVDVPFLMRDRG